MVFIETLYNQYVEVKRIRTKLVLSLLVITLLPVFPVYFLFQGLVERSLEIGFNKNVETALERATTISQELFSQYRRETLAVTKEMAGVVATQKIWGDAAPTLLQKAETIGKSKVDLFDRQGNLIFTGSTDSSYGFPRLYEATLRQLLEKRNAETFNLPGDLTHISAVAPIISRGVRHGSLLFTRAIDEEISQGSQHVVNVHQMFKTLDFFEDDLSKGFLLSFVVVYVPIAAFSVGVGYYFSRKITTPLLQLVEGTKKVSAGDWEHRVVTRSQDEVGELIHAFNSMVGNLKEKQDQVISLEKMAVWREIARILAHEIKNPLTPIQLTVQQMKDKYPGNDPEYESLLAECSEIISEEIESLRTLVKEFSDFARMPQLNPTKGNLNELVTEVGKLYSERPVVLDLDPRLPLFDFDSEKLRRVLINLIENGLDSMEKMPGKTVLIATNRNDNSALLRIQDHGHGIPKEMLQKIFEPYFSTKKTGTGLGLAIVKRIVEEHHGKISVESEPDKGTTFHVALPIV